MGRMAHWTNWNGIMAVITNHGYLGNPTFRRMRKNLIENFNEIYILDLHGNVKKRERSTDESKDENVFDIQQGVAIGIFIKNKRATDSSIIRHAELWGTREDKYTHLSHSDISNTDWTCFAPQSPFYAFSPQNNSSISEYDQYWKITNIMPKNSTGVKTHRDNFVLDFDLSELKDRIQKFRNLAIPDEEIYANYNLQDTRDWKLKQRRLSLSKDPQWEKFFTKCLYRPFDVRYYYHNENVVELPRQEIMQHVFSGDNICLSTTRSIEIGRGWEHTLCSSRIIQHHTVSIKEVNYLFQLYLFNDLKNRQELLLETHWSPCKDGRIPNLDPDFVSAFASRLCLTFVSDGHGDLAATFGPEDIFDYI
jgi:predicted helicase